MTVDILPAPVKNDAAILKVGRPTKGPYHDLHVLLSQPIWEALVDRSQTNANSVTGELESILKSVLKLDMPAALVELADESTATISVKAFAPEGGKSAAELAARANAPEGGQSLAEIEARVTGEAGELHAHVAARANAPDGGQSSASVSAEATAPKGGQSSAEITARVITPEVRDERLQTVRRRINHLGVLFAATPSIIGQVAAIELLREQWALEDGRPFLPREQEVRALLEAREARRASKRGGG